VKLEEQCSFGRDLIRLLKVTLRIPVDMTHQGVIAQGCFSLALLELNILQLELNILPIWL
jgi:hypothetical protein